MLIKPNIFRRSNAVLVLYNSWKNGWNPLSSVTGPVIYKKELLGFSEISLKTCNFHPLFLYKVSIFFLWLNIFKKANAYSITKTSLSECLCLFYNTLLNLKQLFLKEKYIHLNFDTWHSLWSDESSCTAGLFTFTPHKLCHVSQIK